MMDFDKIKPNARVAYTVKNSTGKGKVVSKYAGKTGSWVTIADKDRGGNVTVRPSQVSRA